MKSWNAKLAKELIERDGRTRKWIADQCGVSTESITHYLSGRRCPSTAVIKLLAQTLNTTEEELRSMENSKRVQAT